MSAKKNAKTTKSVNSKKANSDSGVAEFLAFAAKQDNMSDLSKAVEFYSTGSRMLNRAIGTGSGQADVGGFPKGFLTELYGPEGCGKTTACFHAIADCQAKGGKVLFIDFEQAVRAQRLYMQKLGISFDTDKLIVIRPASYEEGVMMLAKALTTYKPDMVVLDSIAAATPKAVADSEMTDLAMQIGLHARSTSIFLSWVTKKLEKHNVALICTNQLRTKIGQISTQISTGGNAVRFYPTIRIEFKQQDKIVEAGVSNVTGAKEDRRVSNVLKVMAVKNKIDKPFVPVSLYLKFGEGFDDTRSLIETASNIGVIKKAGAWYSYESGTTFDFKVQGQAALYELLKSSPAMEDYFWDQLSFEASDEEKADALERGVITENDDDESAVDDEIAALEKQFAL